MALGATITTYTTQTTISSSATNTNLNNLNSVENPTFTTISQTAGSQVTGRCGALLGNPGATGTTQQFPASFALDCINTPTSVTLNSYSTANDSGPTAVNITTDGFDVSWTVTTGPSATKFLAHYVTVGN